MTETTQPDPQVVAWAHSIFGQGHDLTTREIAAAAVVRFPRLGADAIAQSLLAGSRSEPLTVADIPAGQGAASLYIGPDPFGEVLIWEKTGDGTARIMLRSSRWTRALWDHLAATLPTVTDTTEEA